MREVQEERRRLLLGLVVVVARKEVVCCLLFGRGILRENMKVMCIRKKGCKMSQREVCALCL